MNCRVGKEEKNAEKSLRRHWRGMKFRLSTSTECRPALVILYRSSHQLVLPLGMSTGQVPAPLWACFCSLRCAEAVGTKLFPFWPNLSGKSPEWKRAFDLWDQKTFVPPPPTAGSEHMGKFGIWPHSVSLVPRDQKVLEDWAKVGRLCRLMWGRRRFRASCQKASPFVDTREAGGSTERWAKCGTG